MTSVKEWHVIMYGPLIEGLLCIPCCGVVCKESLLSIVPFTVVHLRAWMCAAGLQICCQSKTSGRMLWNIKNSELAEQGDSTFLSYMLVVGALLRFKLCSNCSHSLIWHSDSQDDLKGWLSSRSQLDTIRVDIKFGVSSLRQYRLTGLLIYLHQLGRIDCWQWIL